ncbi:hypothetical protein Y5S_02628 [Alcanivorax nanhaiticus]|uniref:Uncharacterized protein n=1 Tax=Alcanivorax nanhaiticus TaxID=1177154 RepID=A0A095TNZ6_9GAMM|nr:hypothetical protein Y5S_02628 [Alcanivorax nanhaiticus]
MAFPHAADSSMNRHTSIFIESGSNTNRQGVAYTKLLQVPVRAVFVGAAVPPRCRAMMEKLFAVEPSLHRRRMGFGLAVEVRVHTSDKPTSHQSAMSQKKTAPLREPFFTLTEG